MEKSRGQELEVEFWERTHGGWEMMRRGKRKMGQKCLKSFISGTAVERDVGVVVAYSRER